MTTSAIQKLERDMFVSFMGGNLNRAAMPRTWEDAGDLECKYWRNLEREEKREAEVKAEATTIRKSIGDDRMDGMATRAEVDEALVAMATQIRDEVASPLAVRLKAIEESALKWGGTWRSGNTFARNVCVQDKGQLWVSITDGVTTRPGDGNWRLMAKGTAA